MSSPRRLAITSAILWNSAVHGFIADMDSCEVAFRASEVSLTQLNFSLHRSHRERKPILQGPDVANRLVPPMEFKARREQADGSNRFLNSRNSDIVPWGVAGLGPVVPPFSYTPQVPHNSGGLRGAMYEMWLSHRFLTITICALLPTFVHVCIRLQRLSPSTQGAEELLKGVGGRAPARFGRSELFFTAWDSLALFCFICGIFNVRWETTVRPLLALLVVCIEGMLHWFILETPLLAVFTILFKPSKIRRAASCAGKTAVLNYNLMATCEDDIDECMENMFAAYVSNYETRPAAVLVSATNLAELTQYELRKRDEIRDRIRKQMPADVAEKAALDFMVVHRVSRVLRKCGQYQDLMILSSGHTTAFTYCSRELHGKAARSRGEALFHPSSDVDNIVGRRWDYTLVLDSDTGLGPGTLTDLIKVGEAYPRSDIIQPAIEFVTHPSDSVYTWLEAVRQFIFSPMTQVQTSFFSKSPFFGKGMIRTNAYLTKVIGTPEEPKDVVPVDVLSHDTFEAAVTSTLFVPDAFMQEAPCNNYASWSEREMRWNRGELILATYFWPGTFGRLVRGLQHLITGQPPGGTKVAHVQKTLEKLDGVSKYFSHAALRTMSMKLVLLAYLVLAAFVDMWFRRVPLIIVLSSLIVLPKFAIYQGQGLGMLLLETVTSVLQFTTEAVIGSARVIRAFSGLVMGINTWTPQRAVEMEFNSSNPWIHAVRYLWVFSLGAAILMLLLYRFFHPSTSVELYLNLGSVVFLPIHVGATSMSLESYPSWLQSQVDVKSNGG